ncbi:hypothetical protein ACODT3_37015 [Streptomyces sp. 4.24]|uniref:hypothetical protein n=1 Tax=Streptomyces tritrimontium TaxID=3406573 RepID=UPI003BB6D6AF
MSTAAPWPASPSRRSSRTSCRLPVAASAAPRPGPSPDPWRRGPVRETAPPPSDRVQQGQVRHRAGAGSATVAALPAVDPDGNHPHEATPYFTTKDSLGNITYDVRFDGHVRADGPTGWVLKGDLDASGAPGTLTTQYCRLGYKDVNGWAYEVVAIDDTPTALSVRGTRAAGAPLPMCTGATSGPANVYQYGDTVNIKLPEAF